MRIFVGEKYDEVNLAYDMINAPKYYNWGVSFPLIRLGKVDIRNMRHFKKEMSRRFPFISDLEDLYLSLIFFDHFKLNFNMGYLTAEIFPFVREELEHDLVIEHLLPCIMSLDEANILKLLHGKYYEARKELDSHIK